MTTHPFGAQLNRRQGILDLVRQTPSHVPPRGHPLSPDEGRDVVEHHDGAINAARLGGQRRGRYSEVDLLSFVSECHFLGASTAGARLRLHQDLSQRLEILASQHAGRGLPHGRWIKGQQTARRPVDRAHPTLGIHRNYAGCDPLQNRLDVLATLVDLQIRALQVTPRPVQTETIRRQFAGHGVERFDERAELVGALGLNSIVEMTGPRSPGHRSPAIARAG